MMDKCALIYTRILSCFLLRSLTKDVNTFGKKKKVRENINKISMHYQIKNEVIKYMK